MSTSGHQSQTTLEMAYSNITTNIKSHDYNEVNSTTTTTTIIDVLDCYRKYINDGAFVYIIISVMTVTTGLISILGIVTNTLNIIVFIRQGVTSDSSTVSLFGLAIADLLSVASTLWIGIFFGLDFLGPSDLAWDPWDMMYMGGTWPHVITGLITRMITAFISFERCFCVVFPFKVKNVFTPRSSSVLVSSIFAYFFLTYSSVYVLNTFHYITDPETNRTHLILIEDSRWLYVQAVLSYANLYTLNFLPVVVVLVCTTITVSRVNLSSAWRDAMSTSNNRGNHGNTKDFESNSGLGTTAKKLQRQPHKLSNTRIQKEKKMIRMIISISLVFLVCYMPSIATPIIYSYNKEIRTNGGKYKNLAWSIYCICWCFDAINSSINIFIYYKMSSKFNKEFNALFGLSEK